MTDKLGGDFARLFPARKHQDRRVTFQRGRKSFRPLHAEIYPPILNGRYRGLRNSSEGRQLSLAYRFL
jgi:hypothetical protein